MGKKSSGWSGVITLRLDPELREAVQAIAAQYNVTPSDFARHALAQMVGRPDYYTGFAAAKKQAYGVVMRIVMDHMRAAFAELDER